MAKALICNGEKVTPGICNKGGYGKAKEKGYTWEKMLARYVAFKEKNGGRPGCPNGAPGSDGKHPKRTKAQEQECHLYYWMMNQNRLIRTGHMSEDHIMKLIAAGVDIPNHGKFEETFRERCRACQKNFPVRRGDGNYEWLYQNQRHAVVEGLGSWMFNTMKEYGLLDDSKMLYGIRGKKPVNPIAKVSKRDQIWHERYIAYRDYVEKNGTPSQTDEGRTLYFWMRSELRALREGRRTNEQIKMLKKVKIAA